MTLWVETVTEVGRFASLRDDWEKVNLACETGTYFSSHDWLMAWCNWFLTADTSLYVLLFWRKSSLVGIAPFVVRKEKGGINWLYLLGTGESEASEVATEYADVLVLPCVRAEVECLIVEKFQQDASRWDAVRLLNVRTDCHVRHLLARALGRTKVRQRIAGARYCLALQDLPSLDHYLAGLERPSFRKKLQISRRRMLKANGAFFVVGADSAGFENHYADLLLLHENRWRNRGGEGVFSDACFAGFHRDLLRSPGAKSSSHLAVLTLNGAPVALLYLLVYRGECHFYQSGVDTTVKPNVSPGVLAHYLAIEWAIQQGITSYDFMKGGAKSSYKQDFCPAGVNLYNYTVLRPRLGVVLRYSAVALLKTISNLRRPFHKRCAA